MDQGFSQQPDMVAAEKEAPVAQNSYASPPTFQTDDVVAKEVNSASVPQPAVSLVSPPTSLADETDVLQDHADAEGEHSTVLQTPTSNARHSSRQPRHVDRYMPEVHVVKPSKSSVHTPNARRPSFGASSTSTHRTTPGPSSGSKKSSSRPSSSHAKTPTADKKIDRHATLTSPGQTSKHMKRERTTGADGEPDAESMRLIRELQEQEFGLRKRATRA